MRRHLITLVLSRSGISPGYGAKFSCSEIHNVEQSCRRLSSLELGHLHKSKIVQGSKLSFLPPNWFDNFCAKRTGHSGQQHFATQWCGYPEHQACTSSSGVSSRLQPWKLKDRPRIGKVLAFDSKASNWSFRASRVASSTSRRMAVSCSPSRATLVR